MARQILIVPDKFKGTLSAQTAAEAIARGWQKSCPQDQCGILPMSDGGDGFGEVISQIIGANPQKIKTVDAAHRPLETTWWWEPKSKTAVIESAKIIGLAMLPPRQFHPFQLDTAGLGAVLLAAKRKGAKVCLIGIGGSATNDGGFGLARTLGWRFFDKKQQQIQSWPDLKTLTTITVPKGKVLFPKLIIAVDVQNPLLGAKGCSRIYGPQKGLRPEDFPAAENALSKLALGVSKNKTAGLACAPGAGAAGGLGFGLAAFAGGKCESGFAIFARYAELKKRLRSVDLVITGEGSIDLQTLMGKGPGEIAQLCRKMKIPVLALAGTVREPTKARKFFAAAYGLTDITTLETARKNPARFLEELARRVAAVYSKPERVLF